MNKTILALAITANLGGCTVGPVATEYCNENEARAVLRAINPVQEVSIAVGAACAALKAREAIKGGKDETSGN